MGGYMTGSQFGVKVGWRVGIFLALTIGFPFIVYGLIVATGARGVGGASGALAVVAGTFLKPVIILGFVISLLSPCWQRMRSLGFPGFVGLLAPFLFLLDWPYFLAIGAHWGVAFSLGILVLNPPLFAMSALAMLIAMGVASPPDNRSPSQRAVGRIGGVLAIVLFVIALVSTFPMLWVMGRIWLTSAGGKPAPFVLSATLFYWALCHQAVRLRGLLYGDGGHGLFVTQGEQRTFARRQRNGRWSPCAIASTYGRRLVWQAVSVRLRHLKRLARHRRCKRFGGGQPHSAPREVQEADALSGRLNPVDPTSPENASDEPIAAFA